MNNTVKGYRNRIYWENKTVIKLKNHSCNLYKLHKI